MRERRCLDGDWKFSFGHAESFKLDFGGGFGEEVMVARQEEKWHFQNMS